MDTATWTLSGFGDEIDPDPAVQVAVLQALGASHLEVRSVWGTNVLDLSPRMLGVLADLLASKDFGVSAIASPIGKVDVDLPIEGELARLTTAIAAAHRLGTRYIRVFSFYHPGRDAESVRDRVIEHMRALVGLAANEGLVLLHENERDIFGDVPSRILDLVRSVDSPALRVAWDAGNFVRTGVRPFDDAYEPLRPYLDYLQIKDAVPNSGSVVAGAGAGQLPETLAALAATGYSGVASLEPHLASAEALGGFSGPSEFGRAARSFRALADQVGVVLR